MGQRKYWRIFTVILSITSIATLMLSSSQSHSFGALPYLGTEICGDTIDNDRNGVSNDGCGGFAQARQMTSGSASSEIKYNWAKAIAVDGNNILHQVWLEIYARLDSNHPENGGVIGRVMYRNSRDNGTTWSFPWALTNITINIGHPRLTTAGSHVYVAWHEPDFSLMKLQVKMRHSGNNGMFWDQPVPVSQAGGVYPGMAAFQSVVHLVWSNQDPETGAAEVYMRSSPDYGKNWSPVRKVSISDGKSSWVPSIAAFGPHVYVAWTDERHNVDEFGKPFDCATTGGNGSDCREELYFRHSVDFGNSWGSEKRLTNDGDNLASTWAPSLVAAGASVHLAFFDRRTGHFQIYYMKSVDFGETFTAEKRLTNDLAVEYARPSMVVQNNQVHITFWGVYNGIGAFVHYVRSTDGGVTFANPVIPFRGYLRALHPSIAVSGDGTLHFVWYDKDPANGANNQLFYLRKYFTR